MAQIFSPPATEEPQHVDDPTTGEGVVKQEHASPAEHAPPATEDAHVPNSITGECASQEEYASPVEHSPQATEDAHVPNSFTEEGVVQQERASPAEHAPPATEDAHVPNSITGECVSQEEDASPVQQHGSGAPTPEQMLPRSTILSDSAMITDLDLNLDHFSMPSPLIYQPIGEHIDLFNALWDVPPPSSFDPTTVIEDVDLDLDLGEDDRSPHPVDDLQAFKGNTGTPKEDVSWSGEDVLAGSMLQGKTDPPRTVEDDDKTLNKVDCDTKLSDAGSMNFNSANDGDMNIGVDFVDSSEPKTTTLDKEKKTKDIVFEKPENTVTMPSASSTMLRNSDRTKSEPTAGSANVKPQINKSRVTTGRANRGGTQEPRSNHGGGSAKGRAEVGSPGGTPHARIPSKRSRPDTPDATEEAAGHKRIKRGD